MSDEIWNQKQAFKHVVASNVELLYNQTHSFNVSTCFRNFGGNIYR